MKFSTIAITAAISTTASTVFASKAAKAKVTKAKTPKAFPSSHDVGSYSYSMSVNPAPSCDVSGCEEGYDCYDVDSTGEYQCLQSFTGKIVENYALTGPGASAAHHVIIDHNGDFPYIEGQSWGIIHTITIPGLSTDQLGLYSIASPRDGDDGTGKTVSITVACGSKGEHSQKLCDTQPGDEIAMTGPAGKVMLMPEEDPSTDYIMVATGTGIAPFRGFVRRLFFEGTQVANAYKGEAWLFLGVANSDALLYDDEFQDAKAKFPENFRLDYALASGGVFIQDKVEEYADEVFAKLENGAHILFCVTDPEFLSIDGFLEGVAISKGFDYLEFKTNLKNSQRFRRVC